MSSKMEKQNPKIFSPWPCFGDDEINAVTRVLRSGNVNQWTGPEVTGFENEYADYVGVKYAVAVANGSVALDIALAILDIGPGDEVIVTPRSFVASASCVALRGAVPVFVDVDPDSQNITPATVKSAISSKTKAVIAVHLAGWPCELDELRVLCDEHGIYLIEDCAQAHGAKLKDKHVGSFGHIAAFSFCQDKIMTTGGEGGMLVTDDEDLWKKVWSYKDHGKDYDSVFNKKHPPGFRWLVTSFGTNYRMIEMQAAIGRVMLKKLDEWVKRRRRLAGILTDGFKEIPVLRVTIPPDHIYHSYYKYYVFVRPEKLRDGWNRNRILKELEKRGVPCGTGACPEIYLEEAFKNRGQGAGVRDQEKRLPVAKELGETSLMFMVHPTLTKENMHWVVEQVKEVLGFE
jgi:dTDP-4-amino-4,6-dideoxygalactose transaminase